MKRANAYTTVIRVEWHAAEDARVRYGKTSVRQAERPHSFAASFPITQKDYDLARYRSMGHDTVWATAHRAIWLCARLTGVALGYIVAIGFARFDTSHSHKSQP